MSVQPDAVNSGLLAILNCPLSLYCILFKRTLSISQHGV